MHDVLVFQAINQLSDYFLAVFNSSDFQTVILSGLDKGQIFLYIYDFQQVNYISFLLFNTGSNKFIILLRLKKYSPLFEKK